MSKIALVIGNSLYGGDEVSGAEDAVAIAECLKGLDFEVLGGSLPGDPLLNGDLKTTNAALKDFFGKIGDASVALFFYSGHGYQVGDDSYLLPTGGPVSIAGSVRLDDVVQQMGLAPNEAAKFVFVDACRDSNTLPAGAAGGLGKAPQAPAGVVQAFSASPGQLAASGSAGTLSPYTEALLKYLPQAGLALPELFDTVSAEVNRHSPQQQLPLVVGPLPAGFFFRDPVVLPMDFPEGKSDLLVFLRGDLILNTNQPATKDATGQPVKPSLRLKAGDNELRLLISTSRTHRNNHDWDITEGWSYELNLTLPGGKEQHFSGSEDIPFKDGPHYGKVFPVAKVNLWVNPQTSVLSLLDPDLDLSNQEAPFFARDQQVLVQVSIASLNLSPDDILGDTLGNVPAFLKPFLVEFLKSGTVLGATIADPAKTFVTVLGNGALKDLAAGCMAKRDDRIRDLKASIAAVFNRNPTPFKIFDQGLMACMRATAASQGSTLEPGDIQIWTALQDLSNQIPAVAAAGATAAQNAEPVLVA